MFNKELDKLIAYYNTCKFVNEAMYRILDAHKEIANMSSTDQNYGVADISLIESVVNSFYNLNLPLQYEKDYIFWKLLTNVHAFNNGNKRTALYYWTDGFNTPNKIPSKKQILEIVVNKPTFQEFLKLKDTFEEKGINTMKIIKELELE